MTIMRTGSRLFGVGCIRRHGMVRSSGSFARRRNAIRKLVCRRRRKSPNLSLQGSMKQGQFLRLVGRLRMWRLLLDDRSGVRHGNGCRGEGKRARGIIMLRYHHGCQCRCRGLLLLLLFLLLLLLLLLEHEVHVCQLLLLLLLLVLMYVNGLCLFGCGCGPDDLLLLLLWWSRVAGLQKGSHGIHVKWITRRRNVIKRQWL
mmetsp:Transcript_8816/g.16029  ORF Transcript_8816/g.16029 Transcript_8816/m.16029 type:complete len:201 (+) Transcript_8816:1308-1910(+)